MVKTVQFGYTLFMVNQPADQLERIRSIFPFSLLDDEKLVRITTYFEEQSYPAGSTIISFGYPARDLFFVQSGSVRLITHNKSGDQEMGVLKAGDWFGEEVLSGDSNYFTRAVCLSGVTVLKLGINKARLLEDSSTVLNSAFSLMRSSFLLANNHKLQWRAPDEKILLFCRRHSFFLWLRILFSVGLTLVISSFLLFTALAASEKMFLLWIILSVLSLLIGSGICGWLATEWRNDYLIITHDRVCVQRKIYGLFETRQESPLNAILSVSVDTSFWGRVLGFGTVKLKTYTGDLAFSKLPHPALITNLLDSSRQRVIEENSQENRREICNALSGKTSVRKIKASSSSFRTSIGQTYTSGSLSALLARLFRLRSETEEGVTYRTHWLVLFRKTILPCLLFLGILLIAVLRFIGFMNSLPEEFVYLGALVLSLAGWGWWLYQYQDWRNDVYIITEDQLIDVYRKPLSTEDRKTAPIKNIQTVEFERKGLLKLLFNYGTVIIKIGNEKLTFDNVFNPSAVQNEIYTHYKASQEKDKKNEQQRFVEWIKMYDEIKNHTAEDEENR